MNKDVLYIASEDDITDVVQKIEKAKNRIIAIVPPDDNEIFHSIVNMKLINKTAKSSGKTAVIVTTDETISNLAANLHIPVTKDLKSAPTVPAPSENSLADDKKEDESISSDLFDQFKKEGESEKSSVEESKEDKKDQIEPEVNDKKTKKEKKEKRTSDNPMINWLLEHKKIVIISGAAIILIILFVIWATIFAPSASVSIDVKTTSKSFSSNVTFTKTAADEDADSGKFYLEEKKIETPEKIEFKATGSKNIGTKASGELEIAVAGLFGNLLNPSGSFSLPEGTIFVYSDLEYITTGAVNKNVSSYTDCSNYNPDSTIAEASETECIVVFSVGITATEIGEKYNINGLKQDWSNSKYNFRYIQNNSSVSGGSDKIITVVSKEDVEKAEESLTTTTDTEAKKTILGQLSEGSLAINSSFKKTVSELEITPKVGEEIPEGTTPSISRTTTLTINYVDSVRIEEFIRATAQLASDQKIYSVGEPFIENFNSDSNSGKLKTTYKYGPKITAEEILEKVKGKKIGEAKALLNSINGASSTIETSFFWVNSIPNDSNKIDININLTDSAN